MTGAWIVTGGMHAGVMKHVGEAVREFTVAQGSKSKIVALGIVPWGAVNNKEALVSEDRKVRLISSRLLLSKVIICNIARLSMALEYILIAGPVYTYLRTAID